MYLLKQEINKLIEYIESYDSIIIHRHVRPDPDALGSQIGLKLILQESYPNKKIFAVGSQSNGLAWMGQMDKIDSQVYGGSLVIVVDTANTERVDDQAYSQGESVVKIDHHPQVEPYGDFQIVHPEASSCSELIAEICHYSDNKLKINSEAASLLYAGIVGDTGRFMFDATTAITFEVAARLMAYDIPAYEINDRFNTMTKNLAKFQGYLLENLQITESGVAYFLITRQILEDFNITEEESNQVVNLPSTIEGIYTWVMFVEEEGNQDKWRIRLRSKGPAINDLAAQYQGGGHPKASGAKVQSREGIKAFIKDLEALTLNYLQEINH